MKLKSLKKRASVIPDLEDKLDLAHKNREVLIQMLNEREATIANLSIRVSDCEKELILFETLKSKHMLLSQEAQRLNTILVEKLKEIDALRIIAQEKAILDENYAVMMQDRDHLSTTLKERIQEIMILKKQIEIRDEQLSVIPELKGKITLLASENDRLSSIIIEKITIIEEWQMKYEALEQLYLTVKETTEHLDFIKRRYQEAVQTSEKVHSTVRLFNK